MATRKFEKIVAEKVSAVDSPATGRDFLIVGEDTMEDLSLDQLEELLSQDVTRNAALLDMIKNLKSQFESTDMPDEVKAEALEAIKMLAALAEQAAEGPAKEGAAEKAPKKGDEAEGYGYPAPKPMAAAGEVVVGPQLRVPVVFDTSNAVPVTVQTGSNVQTSKFALTAHAAPHSIPREWFDNPEFSEPTPLTVTDDGRVYGHVALSDTCHIGLPGCVPPPMPGDYSYFHRQPIQSTAGPVLTGPITLTGGHFTDLRAGLEAAQAHYDDPKSVVARVVVGEDQFGIWAAGTVLPGTKHEDMSLLSSSDISGDWRPIRGSHKLVGICAVAVPGFPIVKPLAASASDPSLALIGAGAFPRNELWRMPISELVTRIEALERLNKMVRPLVAASIKSRVHRDDFVPTEEAPVDEEPTEMPEVINLNCPGCGVAIEVALTADVTPATCSSCKKEVIVARPKR